MAATTTESIEPLAAIGRLDYAGYEDEYHCTATLTGKTTVPPGRAALLHVQGNSGVPGVSRWAP